MGQQRLWTQTIQIKDPAPRPHLFSDRQVVINYDHDPDTDEFTVDLAGAIVTGGGAQDIGIALRHLVGAHPKVVQDRFAKIVPTQYHGMYGGSTEDMERAVMQYVGYVGPFDPGQMPPYSSGAPHQHGWGPQGHVAVGTGSGASGVTGADVLAASGQSSVTGTTTITTTASGTGTNQHSHQVPFQPTTGASEAWAEAMSLVVEDITNVYGESEEGSSMETLAAALLDTIRLFKERL